MTSATPATPAADQPDLMQVALDYAARGWSVVPLHSPSGIPALPCTCRKRHCDSPGKHPRTKNGLKDASRDPDQVRRWWTSYPQAGVAIVTGKASGGLCAIDCDDNKSGIENFRDLASQNGDLPDTPISITGGGGQHVLFISTRPVQNSVSKLAPGVDVRGEGGYIVAPPSLHISGRRYQWELSAHPLDIPVAIMPDWLFDLSNREREAASARMPEDDVTVIQGARNDTLFKLACKLRRAGLGGDAIFAALVQENARRCVPALDEREVKQIAHSATRYGADDPYYDSPGAPPQDTPIPDTAAPQTDWLRNLIRKPSTKNGPGSPVSCAANTTIILANDPEWRNVIVYNGFTLEVFTRVTPPWLPEDRPDEPAPRWLDADDTRLSNWMLRQYDLKIASPVARESAVVAAERNLWHPVRQYFASLDWDQAPRLHSWLADYLGCVHDEYTASVGTWWLISAVARIMRPGCKADHVLILEGGQGAGKSTALRNLVPNPAWFFDSTFEIGEKDAYMSIRGRMIVELAELDSLARSDPARIKGFFSSGTDAYRPPYGRSVVDVPRQCVFAGTVNPEGLGYLNDSTGARRFWPVKCEAVRPLDYAGLAANRDQIWAEAYSLFVEGRQWWPTSEMQARLEEEQAARYRGDVWEEIIADWLGEERARRAFEVDGYLTMQLVLESALKLDTSRMDQNTQSRAGKALRALKFKRGRKREGDSVVRCYRPSEDSPFAFLNDLYRGKGEFSDA